MSHKPTRCKFTTFKQRCEFITPCLVAKPARAHGGSIKKACNFSPWSRFNPRE